MLADGFTSAAAGAAPTCTATASTASCAPGAARGSRPSPPAAPSPTSSTTTCCSSRRASASARVNEDFAIESMAGDIFQLGNTSYRILKVEPGRVRVEDAQGEPPNIPFWLGEAPGRTDELSEAVSRLRAEASEQLDASAWSGDAGWADGLEPARAPPPRQLVDYLAAAQAALGAMPTQSTLVLRALLRRSRRHAPGHARPLRLRASTAPGAWPCASASAAASTSSCRPRPPRTRSCSRSAPSTASRSRTWPATSSRDGARRADAGPAGRAHVRDALALERRPSRWRCGASATASACPRQFQRMRRRGPARGGVPGPARLRREPRRRPRVPDHPLVRQTIDDCLRRGHGHRRPGAPARGLEGGEVQVSAPRPDRALAARAGILRRAPMPSSTTPRRGAAHPGGAPAPWLTRPTPPPGTARSGGHRRVRARPGPSPRPRRAARRPRAAGLRHRSGIAERIRLGGLGRRTDRNPPRHSACSGQNGYLGGRRTAGRGPGRTAECPNGARDQAGDWTAASRPSPPTRCGN